jgi:hypothetical protein
MNNGGDDLNRSSELGPPVRVGRTVIKKCLWRHKHLYIQNKAIM